MKTIKNYLNAALLTESQQIFTVIKPGFLNLQDEIVKLFQENGWEIYKNRTMKLSEEQAKRLYQSHKKEDFFEPLVKYMSSGLSEAIIYSKSGRTDSDTFKATDKIKDEIRKKWGESDMRNVMHSSDSLEHMIEEMSVYF